MNSSKIQFVPPLSTQFITALKLTNKELKKKKNNMSHYSDNNNITLGIINNLTKHTN